MRLSFGLFAVFPFFLTQCLALSAGCQALLTIYPNVTFAPDSARYAFEYSNFWSNTEILDPSCVFIPTTAEQVATALTTIKSVNGTLGTRSGGHMGIPGSNDVDGDVLMAMSNMTTLELDTNHSHVKVGPGWHWGEVYSKLASYNLTVAGGRLSGVGVAGLLLGGGIHFYGNQYGFACDKVSSYEVVLANGSIINATADNQYTDLFWALKGGSSNFGVVTAFELETIPSTQVFAGSITVANEYLPAVYEAIANYSADIYDPKSHIVPAVVPSYSNGTISSVGAIVLFYDNATEDYPAILQPFLDIPTIASTMGFKSLAEMAIETGELITQNINDVFVAGTVVGSTYATLLQGVQIINDTFYNALPSLYARVPTSAISLIELDWQPIGHDWISASQNNGVVGNPLGLNSSAGTYLCYAEVVEWTDSAYDDIVFAWVESTTYAINNATSAAGLYSEFTYMGDATGFQIPGFYNGYGDANKQALYDISVKYDPDRFFQINMPGGFKISASI